MMIFLHRHPLAIIVLAQLCGTSLWFSMNGVGLSLSRDLGLTAGDLGRLTLTVQAGFIFGTLSIAVSGLADRFRASRIFAVSYLLGALTNAAFVLASESFAASPALRHRLVSGRHLPPGHETGNRLDATHKGAALAWLVGMLTLGAALPHLMRGTTLSMPWEWALLGASLLALAGGAIIHLLGDGPHLPPPAEPARLKEGIAGLSESRFRAVAGKVRHLGAHLVEVLGDARGRLGRHHPRHGKCRSRHHQHGQSDDLQAKPDIHGAVEP